MMMEVDDMDERETETESTQSDMLVCCECGYEFHYCEETCPMCDERRREALRDGEEEE
jgi:uncharacterized OB-fold protein